MELTGNVQIERIDPRVATALRRGSLAVYTAVAIAALTMVALWVAGDLLPALGLPRPPAVTNSPICVGLVAAAGALAMLGRRRAAVALAAVAFAIAAVTTAEHLLGASLGADLSLIGSPGRLYPTTAAAILLMAPAVTMIGGPRPDLGQALAFAAGAIAMTTLAGQVSGVEQLGGDGDGGLLRMSASTAAALLLLAIARIVSEPDRGRARIFASAGPGGQLVRRSVPLLVPAPLLIALLAATGSNHGFWDRATAELILVMALMLGLLAALLTQARTLDRLARERLAASERTASFFDLSHDMLCTLGEDRHLVELNGSWTRALGYAAEELRARPAIEFVHPDDRRNTLDVVGRAIASGGTEQVAVENRVIAKGGGWRWLSWSFRLGHDGDYLYGRATDITERKRADRRLAFLARHDQLTGLANRHSFEERLADHLASASRYGWRGSLLAIDLDGLKAVNDGAGHAAGDALLRLAAERMRDGLRRSDILARIGGDEFAVLLPEATTQEAELVAAGLARGLAAPAAGGAAPIASIGVATLSRPISAIDLMAAADRALYGAKRAGGGTYRIDGRSRPNEDGPAPARGRPARRRTRGSRA